MMGIEAVKSSTPAPCRTMIKEGLKLMMNGTEEDVIDSIDKCRVDSKNLPPEEIFLVQCLMLLSIGLMLTSTLRELIHCRGALL